MQGGNFHLKVGGAKSSGNADDPMLGIAVSGGSRIHTTTTRWEVVKNSASQKSPFFIYFFRISCHFSHFRAYPEDMYLKWPPLDSTSVKVS